MEEKQAYAVLKEGSNVIRSVLAFYKLKSLRNYVFQAERRASAMMSTIPVLSEGQKRELVRYKFDYLIKSCYKKFCV